MKKIIILLFSVLSLLSLSVSVVIPQKLLLEDMKPVLQKAKTYETKVENGLIYIKK